MKIGLTVQAVGKLHPQILLEFGPNSYEGFSDWELKKQSSYTNFKNINTRIFSSVKNTKT